MLHGRPHQSSLSIQGTAVKLPNSLSMPLWGFFHLYSIVMLPYPKSLLKGASSSSVRLFGSDYTVLERIAMQKKVYSSICGETKKKSNARANIPLSVMAGKWVSGGESMSKSAKGQAKVVKAKTSKVKTGSLKANSSDGAGHLRI